MFSVRDLFTLIRTSMNIGPEKRRHSADHLVMYQGFDRVPKYVGCSCDNMEECGGFKADIYTIPSQQHRLSKLKLRDLHNARKQMSVSTTIDDVEKINRWFTKQREKKGQSASDTEAIKREVTMYNNDSSCILAILLGFIAAIVFGGICIGSIFIG